MFVRVPKKRLECNNSSHVILSGIQTFSMPFFIFSSFSFGLVKFLSFVSIFYCKALLGNEMNLHENMWVICTGCISNLGNNSEFVESKEQPNSVLNCCFHLLHSFQPKTDCIIWKEKSICKNFMLCQKHQ